MIHRIEQTYRVTSHSFEDGVDEVSDEQVYRVRLETDWNVTPEFGKLELLVNRQQLAKLPFGHDVRVTLELPAASDDAIELARLKKRFDESHEHLHAKGAWSSTDEISDKAVAGAAIELAEFVCRR
jgi:hypothetical protein